MKQAKQEAFSDDKLKRKDTALHFKNILLNTDLNVFSLTAPWGGGKTYFINNLIKMLEKDSINVLYNAWESDFYDSPLIPLLVELLNKLEICNKKSKLEEDIIWSKKFAEKICKSTTLKAGLNAGIANCSLNFDSNKKMMDSEYIELKNQIQKFKDKLKLIQKKLNKKIIIFIDELDRCHPMYTIKTLEVIKHFFGISNIIFVLAVDKKQIENSVRTIYGINKGQENGYLRKFIDVEFQLPNTDYNDFIKFHINKIWHKIEIFIENSRYYNYCMHQLIDQFGYLRGMDIGKEQDYLANLILQISSLLNFSIRDIEKYFMRFSLILDELTSKDILFIEPCIILNALSMHNLEEFNNYIYSNQSEQIKEINKTILSHWKGLLFKAYKEELDNFYNHNYPNNEPLRNNALKIEHILNNFISKHANEQEKYLQEYPLKIKFINNFQTFD